MVGGGQPRSTDGEIREKRRGALLWEDEHKKLRKSHENPAVMAIYGEFLGEPNGPLSHKLLHTSYVKRGKYNEFTDETAVIEIPVDSRKVSVDSRERQNTMGARLKASPAIQPSGDSERAMALVSENTRLKNELKDSKETIEILRNIVADYSNPDR
ncbi:iron hydrogenase small subunit [Cloacibacillus porcorum]|uniref:iron hydrogenase small subunit n=1 Tax=Cloacibacillus porcorum TaxID=1197717 RepID=UPI0023F1559B|nr:iron hydrogenase small subunit [Cloacibacillus porcorum]